MLLKEPKFNQTTQSCKQVIIDGKTMYQIEDLPKDNDKIEIESMDVVLSIPTINERVDAIEQYIIEKEIYKKE